MIILLCAGILLLGFALGIWVGARLLAKYLPQILGRLDAEQLRELANEAAKYRTE